MKWLLSILFSLLLSSCVTTPPAMRHALVDQILRPRVGHKSLTNSACDEVTKSGKCTLRQVIEYDLNDEALRKKLNDLRFICSVGGKRYKICMDKPGLCRHDRYKKWFLGRTWVKEEYIPIEDYQMLLDGNTRCFSRERYPFEGV